MKRDSTINTFSFAGVVMLFSFTGLVYSACAAVSHAIYYNTKYPAEKLPVETLMERSAKSHSLYPFNYYVCILAAEEMWAVRRGDADGDELPERMDAVSKWCERGLALNPWKKNLRLMQTRLLRFNSPQAALAYWEPYVDWDYWNAFNHAVLVELYCDSGDLAKAALSLKMVKGSGYYRRASDKLQKAWKKEMELPDLGTGKKGRMGEGSSGEAEEKELPPSGNQ